MLYLTIIIFRRHIVPPTNSTRINHIQYCIINTSSIATSNFETPTAQTNVNLQFQNIMYKLFHRQKAGQSKKDIHAMEIIKEIQKEAYQQQQQQQQDEEEGNDETANTMCTSTSTSTLSTINDEIMIDNGNDTNSSTTSSKSTSTSKSSPSKPSILKTVNSTPTPKSKRVQFGDLQMRFYNRILGDNPACSNDGGPPLSLDWTYHTLPFSTSISEYETNRLPRRTRRQFLMTHSTRRNMMVYHFGYTHQDVDKAARSTSKIRKQRDQTRRLSAGSERRQEIVQSLRGKFRKSSSSNNLLKDRYYQKTLIQAHENDGVNQLLMMIR